MSTLTGAPQPSAPDTTAGEDAPTSDALRTHPPDPTPDDGTSRAETPLDGDPRAGAPGGRRRWWRTALGWVTTALAGLLVLFALNAPIDLNQFTSTTMVRLSAEGLLAAALLLALPARARSVVVTLLGVFLGLLTLVKLLDMGFHLVYVRPVDLVFDWSLLDDGMAFLTESIGRPGALGVAAAAVLLVVALLVGTPLAVRRLTRVMVGHRAAATRVLAGLTVLWVACAAFGASVPGLPRASDSVAVLTYDTVRTVPAALRDRQAFAEESAVDAFGDTPGEKLLTGLRGKDVLITFIESYGRDAVEDPYLATRIGPMLDAGTRRLRGAGFASRSAYLTSTTVGGGSWLAHATLLSGLRIDNEQRYRTLTGGDRLTLGSAFQRANWRTVGVMPRLTGDWPEGEIFGYDTVYDARTIGYAGPRFNWAGIPDQYSLSAFQRFERAQRDRGPVMAEIELISSHAPWTPVPRLVDWADVGDGSGATSDGPRVASRDRDWLRAQYPLALEYSLNTLLSYVENYGDENLVLVFLGDHQPPLVTEPGASWDVPITIVAHDPAVLERIDGWGWHDGLKPGPRAPVWPMESFRDRFLTAFGPTPTVPVTQPPR